ncbi:PKD domain-containing protein [Flavobacterium sp.]|uniref:PKD domain-containing protein n=1 Tax=Flavobacterium sp. TaxID=239 RepID=UPI00248909AB|nr:PKD domain-containing protein [Flavobacterium sp.]MDI1315791.1 PKD domain-containing protein [Flavobacterium sp.]
MKHIYIAILLVLGQHLAAANENKTLLAPSATISGGTSVCQNSANPVITFTGSGGTAPYTFTYTLNGISQTPIVSSGNVGTLTANTAITGTFTYNLVSVQDSSGTQNLNLTPVVITVNAPPTINFTFTNDNTCSGTVVQFTSTVSGAGTNNYSWDFGDGSPLSTQQNPMHSFTSLGCGTTTFSVVLTVTRGGCTVTRTQNVTVKQKPDISFNDPNATSSANQFSNCTVASLTNTSYSITVDNTSASLGCITSYSINWGDTTPSQNNINFPISHTYTQLSVYNMVITAIGNFNCSNSVSYEVKNISNPSAGVLNPGGTVDMCIPSPVIQYTIGNWAQNSPGTTYAINYGDNSPIVNISQATMVASPYYNAINPLLSTNYPIPYSYNTNSCLNGGGDFIITLVVTNACRTTTGTVVGGNTRSKPVADFTSLPIECITSNVLFSNTTILGYDSGCVRDTRFTWNFGDPASGANNIITTGWVTNATNANHIFSAAGLYTITLTAQNGCGTTTKTQQICIESPLVPLFTLSPNTGCTPLAVNTTNNTNLANQCSPPIYLWNVTYASGNCGSLSAFTYTGGTSATSANPSFNFTEAGTYSISVTIRNSCGPVTSAIQTVVVKKPPSITLINGILPNYCGSANVNPIATVNSCAPASSTLTYSWSFPGGTPSTSNFANPVNINYPTTGNYTISLVVSNECGPSNTATQSFVVNPTPVITNSSLSQTICSGSATTLVTLTAIPVGTTFSWTASATAGISGFTSSGTTNTIPSQIINTTNTNPGTITYLITPTVGGCIGAPVNYVVTVNPAPSITTPLQPSSVCLGGTPTPLTIVLNSSAVVPTYQWYSNTSSSTTGGTLISGATNATFNPLASTVGTLYYYCVISLSSGGCSSITSNIVTVTVNPLPTITVHPTPTQSICVGGVIPTLNVSYAGGLGTPTYQWYSNTTSTSSGGTSVGTNSSSYTPPVFNTAGTFYYYAVVSLSGNGCGTVSSNSSEIIVVADPTLTIQPLTTQTVCQNSAATALTVVASGGVGSYTYQWYTNPNSTTPSGTLISGATNASYSPPTNIVGTQYYYCIITQTDLGCSVTSAIATVIVVNAPQIITQPQSASICEGAPQTPLNVAYNNGTGTASYQWYDSTGLISGATSASYTPTNTVTTNYYCIITFSSGGCTSITSATATVTINTLPTIALQPTPTQSICIGGVIPILTVSYIGGVGTPTYQWYSNTTSTTSGGTSVGTNSSSYTPPVFNTAGTFYYYVTVSLSGNGCGTAISNVAQVIVIADPIINTQPLVTQTQCQNSTATPLTVVSSGGIGIFNYQWYNTLTPVNTGGTPIGTNTSSFTPPTSTVGTFYYYCLVSQSGLGCSVASTIATVIVVNAPQIITQPQSVSICEGAPQTPLTVTYSNGTGTASYQWYDSTALISGATSATYTPTNTVTTDYYCIITFSSGGCTSITSATATITVNPLPAISLQPTPTQSICAGGSISALTVSYSGGLGTPTYQWYSNTTSSTSGGTPVGTNSSSYTPPVFNTAGTFYYYVVISLNGSGCGNITSQIAQIDVVPDPSITTQPLVTQTQCQSSAATPLVVVSSGGIGTFNYQWYSNTSPSNSGGTAIPGATTDIYIPLTDVVGTKYYYCVITQSGVGCNVTSAVATVIVVTAPIITIQPQSDTVCFGSVLTPLTIAYINGTGTASYQWYDDNGIIVGAINDTYTPTNTITTSFYCIITFASGGCTSITSNTATVTINPIPTVDQQPILLQSVCVGIDITPLTVSYIGGFGTVTYQWYSNTNNSTIGGTPVGTNSASYTPQVYTIANSYYYYVTLSFSGSGCGTITSSVAQVDVVNDQTVTVQPLVTQTVCQNSLPTVLGVTVSGGLGTVYNYQWYSSSTNNTTSGTVITGETNNTFIPPTITAGTVYYYCLITQAVGSGCNATTNTAEVIVNVAPALANQPISSTVCVNETPTLLSLTYTNGIGIPTYQWFSNTINSNIGGNTIASATNATYSALTVTSGTTYYYCVITFPTISGGCSVITTDPATVIVNDNPVIAPLTSTICSATTFTVTPANSGGNIVPIGTTYSWSTPIISPVGTITGASAQPTPQIDISQTLVNTSTNPSTVTYTVTPISGVCTGANFTVTITVNPAINPNIVLNDNLCFGVNIASITTNITGGIPFSSGTPYTISWTGPNGFTSTATSISNLAPGNYDVTIADAGGCPFSNTYTITEPAAIAITVDSENDITCFNATNGSITISVTGGTGAYVYTWTKDTSPYADVTQDIANLAPGVYIVSVTDANNCGPTTATFTITQPPLLVVSLVSQTNVLCFGAATGEIFVNVVGGTVGSGYTFSWTGPNSFTSSNQNLNAIVAGMYDLTVTDANGCQKNLSVTITQSTDIVIAYTTTPITCYGADNASISVTLSGGNPPYQYQWSNLATTLNQTNLSAGNYTITVTDAVGCPKVETINIPQAPVFTINPIVANISCFGAQNGSINLNLTGGITPVALTWSDGSTSGLIRNNLGPGTYTATISDGTPCFIVRTFTIVEPQPLILSANITNAFNCTNASSGAIDLIVAGGTPPFGYSWSNGSSTEDLSSITSGNYLVTVTDANGCIKTEQFPITRPDPIVLNVTTQTTFDCAAHTVDQNFVAQASGGIPAYQFQWSSGTISGANNEIMQSPVNGTVLLTVTDSYGCTATQTVVVDTPTLGYPSFDTTSIGYATYGIYAIGDPITFQSTITGDYLSVSWDFGDGTFSTDLNPTHIYAIPKDYVVTQTVTYPFGCVYVQTITLIVEKGYLLVVPTAFTPNGDTINDTFRPVTKRLKNVRLDVYDTWGSIIYSETGDVLVGWDAKIKGFNAENGNYYAKVTAETFYGTVINENQTFVLIK